MCVWGVVCKQRTYINPGPDKNTGDGKIVGNIKFGNFFYLEDYNQSRFTVPPLPDTLVYMSDTTNVGLSLWSPSDPVADPRPRLGEAEDDQT